MLNREYKALLCRSLPASEGPKDIIQQFQYFMVKAVVENYFIHLHWALFFQEDLWLQKHT